MKWHVWLATGSLISLLAGCASDQHLVFFTNSTIGIEIGSDPSAGTPVKFVVGYKRQEGVMDPLIPRYTYQPGANAGITQPTNGQTPVVLVPNGTLIPDGTQTKPHSVIAKINFGAVGPGTNATTAQWFATGDAADLVARNGNIGAALTGDPANGTSTTIGILSGKDSMPAIAHLNDIYDFLKKAASSDESSKLIAKVNAIDSGIFKEPIAFYELDKSDTNIVKPVSYSTKADEHDFSNISTYLAKLSVSMNTLQRALTDSKTTLDGTPISDAKRAELLNEWAKLNSRNQQAIQTLSDNADIIAMINYVYTKVFLVKKGAAA